MRRGFLSFLLLFVLWAPSVFPQLIQDVGGSGIVVRSLGSMSFGAAENASIFTVLQGSVTLDPGSIEPSMRGAVTFTLTGARPGDIALMQPSAALNDDLLFVGTEISSENTVNVFLYNASGIAIDDAATNWSFLFIGFTNSFAPAPPDPPSDPTPPPPPPPPTAGFSGPAELPRVTVDCSEPITANTVTLCASGCDYGLGELQLALDTEPRDTTLSIAAGSVLTDSTISLPSKAGSGWVVIRSDGTLPAPGTRIDITTDAAEMATLRSDGTNDLISVPAEASHYFLRGLIFENQTGSNPNDLIDIGSSTLTDNFPHHIIFDQVVVDGGTEGVKRAITPHATDFCFINGQIFNAKRVGQDTQAIGWWDAPGPHRIENSYLEAAGENILVGGARVGAEATMPKDITIRGNLFSKPLTWNPNDPTYDGSNWSVKNLLELKVGVRVLIEGNRFEHSWVDAQTGYGILFTVKTQDQTDTPWVTIQDVAFTNNRLTGMNNGINILTSDSNPHTPMKRIHIANNVTQDVGKNLLSNWGTSGGRIVQLLGADGEDIHIEHNTMFNGRMIVSDAGNLQGFIFQDNIWEKAQFGFKRSGVAEGTASLGLCCPEYTWLKNVMVGANLSIYPPDNFAPASISEVGFTDSDELTGNFELLPSSSFKNAATDGTDPGVDWAEFNKVCSGC